MSNDTFEGIRLILIILVGITGLYILKSIFVVINYKLNHRYKKFYKKDRYVANYTKLDEYKYDEEYIYRDYRKK